MGATETSSPLFRSFAEHDKQSLLLTLDFAAPTPTNFHKVKLGDTQFAELPPNSKLTGTAPYHSYGQMTESQFPGWKDLARILAVSSFCSSAVIETDSEHCDFPRLAIKGVLFLEADENQQESAERIRKEAEFYGQHLREFQGKFVPKHYGLWHAPTSQWGGEVLIAVMEWGGMELGAFLRHKPKSATVAIRLRIVEALDELHDHGIYHTQIGKGHERHILCDPEGTSFRFVDFSDAVTGHDCRRMLPVRTFMSYPSEWKFGCPEAYGARECMLLFEAAVLHEDDVEKKFAFMKMQQFLDQGMSQKEALSAVGNLIDRWRMNPDIQTNRTLHLALERKFNANAGLGSRH
ncbi:hypothetical protein C8J55DRAFT_39090 [Lentinula edodes]|uniref:Protein kinase domain-containing protein n=1 Tax=Lentinula lateritia TaxID=40482 RepID=A0A9W9DSM2_9AGAR|nr:hypothetical protein C8J55DRAFT_39090 [Lentinula edodes]